MPDEHLRKASHIGLWISMAIIAVFIWILWTALHSKIKNESFAAGSKQINNNKVIKNYALASLDLALLPLTFHGCVRANKLEETESEQTNSEIVDSKTLVNAATEDKQ